MAKILFGVGVADARNKLGGHVFSKNAHGAYIRQKVSPTQPRSASQLAVRASFTNFAKAWGSDLTDTQRASWISLAAVNPIPDQFGNPQILSGSNFYQRVNRNLHTIGAARLDDAPADQAVTGLTTVSITGVAPAVSLDVAFTPTPLGAGLHLVVTASPMLSPGRSFFGPFLKLVFADTAAATASPVSILAAWQALFGTLISNQKIGISAYVVNDVNGAASGSMNATAIIS